MTRPLQSLLQSLLGRPVDMIVHEDNQPCIAIIKKGYSPSLRCLVRTQRCSLGVVHETFHEPAPEGFGKSTLIYTKSELHKGDLLTKYLDKPGFEKALGLIRVAQRDQWINSGSGSLEGECLFNAHKALKN
jgi:hypothetical protein